MIDKISSLLSRLFFAIAIFLLFIALFDRLLGFFGWRLTFIAYQASRLIEFSAILMIFVIALILRQVRESLQK